MKPINRNRQKVVICMGCNAPMKVNKKSRETHCYACRGFVKPWYTANRLATHVR